MTTIDGAARRPNLKPHTLAAALAASAAGALVVAIGLSRPNLELLLVQPAVIQAHVYTAVAAFVLGTVILLARKGRTFHRVAGWTWVTLMTLTAGASLFIIGVNGGYWSYIHILSGVTLLLLPFAVMAARKHNVQLHSRQMLGLYVGGMLIAGGFTFVPGRLMWAIFFG